MGPSVLAEVNSNKYNDIHDIPVMVKKIYSSSYKINIETNLEFPVPVQSLSDNC